MLHRLGGVLKVIHRIGEISTRPDCRSAMGGDVGQGRHLRLAILLDDPGAQTALAFNRCGAGGLAGGGEAGGFIGGGPGLSAGDWHGGALPHFTEGFGIEPEDGRQGGHRGVLNVRGGHGFNGDQPPGGDTDLPTQGLGGLVVPHAVPPDKFAEVNNLFVHV